jgi:hypothetical protein
MDYIKLADLIKHNDNDSTNSDNNDNNVSDSTNSDNNDNNVSDSTNSDNNDDTAYVKLAELIKQVPHKTYQLIYNETSKQFELNGLDNKENIHHHCMLKFNMRGYNVMCVSYVISEIETYGEYLKIIGMLFEKDGRILYSVDIVKESASSMAEIQFNTYSHEDGSVIESTIIDKIEVFPEKNKTVEYLIRLLSHDKIVKIYE